MLGLSGSSIMTLEGFWRLWASYVASNKFLKKTFGQLKSRVVYGRQRKIRLVRIVPSEFLTTRISIQTMCTSLGLIIFVFLKLNRKLVLFNRLNIGLATQSCDIPALYFETQLCLLL